MVPEVNVAVEEIRIEEDTKKRRKIQILFTYVASFFNNQEEFKPDEVTVEVPDSDGFSWSKLFKFIGPALFISIGYLDPGNWATDIAGGSQFGYSLIWVLFLSNCMALTLQVLASRIGVVTQMDLAELCKQEYKPIVCKALWCVCEIAIAATDLAEVLGTAIGLQLLFGLDLIWGVLLTASDTLVFLIMQKYGIRKLEVFILVLVAIIAMCFVTELFIIAPPAVPVLKGFIPTLTSDSISAAVGILGATVMPHNFFLHSSIVQSRKVKKTAKGISQALLYNFWDTLISLNIAFFVNVAILIVASAVFYKQHLVVTELQQAHNLLGGLLNSNVAPVMFGLGLFCSGQSSTLTGTMAGQIVMEGFIDLKMIPWLRRLVTRLIAIVPAVITIFFMQSEGAYQLLIISQQILSFALPFAVVPLVQFACSPTLMGPFVNPLWLKILSWGFSVFIIGLNVWAIGEMIGQLLYMSTVALALTVVFLIPVCLALVVLLFYLIFLWRKSDSNPFSFDISPSVVDMGESNCELLPLEDFGKDKEINNSLEIPNELANQDRDERVERDERDEREQREDAEGDNSCRSENNGKAQIIEGSERKSISLSVQEMRP